MHHRTDSVSNGLSRQIASEFGMNCAPVSTGTSPQITLVLFGWTPEVTVCPLYA